MSFFSSAFIFPAVVGTVALLAALATVRTIVSSQRFPLFVGAMTGVWLVFMGMGGFVHTALVEAGAMLQVAALCSVLGITHINARRSDQIED